MSELPPPIIVGPASLAPDQVRWQKKADELEFTALDTVRGVAEKWAASLAAILGIFGTVLLVKGRDEITKLTTGFQIAVGLLLLAALVTAATATWFAAFAAQGTPTDLKWPTGAKLRTFERKAALDAKDRLKRSRILTFVTVLLLATAVGLTWFGDAKPPETTDTNILMVSPTAGTQCGPLGRGPEGHIVLKTGETTQVPLDPAASQTVVVASCPSP